MHSVFAEMRLGNRSKIFLNCFLIHKNKNDMQIRTIETLMKLKQAACRAFGLELRAFLSESYIGVSQSSSAIILLLLLY